MISIPDVLEESEKKSVWYKHILEKDAVPVDLKLHCAQQIFMEEKFQQELSFILATLRAADIQKHEERKKKMDSIADRLAFMMHFKRQLTEIYHVMLINAHEETNWITKIKLFYLTRQNKKQIKRAASLIQDLQSSLKMNALLDIK